MLRSMLENGAQAFKGVSNFVIADVPGKFIGARMITMHTKPTEQLVSFEVSNHSLVYVAIPTLSNTHPVTYTLIITILLIIYLYNLL